MLSVIKRKIKTISAVLKSKEATFMREMASLVKLRQEKIKALEYLNIQQKAYIEGVDKLNKLRMDPARQGLAFFETNIDKVKDTWVLLHRTCQQIDKALLKQTELVTKVKSQLDGVEKLKRKYENELSAFYNHKDQEYLDEVSQQKKYLERKQAS
jgi:hypothetical protein